MVNFKKGKICKTLQLDRRYKSDEQFAKFVNKCLERYAKNDWGDIPEKHKKLNDQAALVSGVIIAIYSYDDKDKVIIETTANGTGTCVRFAARYDLYCMYEEYTLPH